MKIALIGYGKMGQAIEKQALTRGHEIVLKISADNLEDFKNENLEKADVAIEFTNPHSAVSNIKKCMEAKVPVICGTTAWLKDLEDVKKYVEEHNGSLLYASNFSLGVNLFFLMNEYAAKLMSSQSQYKTSIKEIHHTAKLDAPSGTAITLAEGILQNHDQLNSWVSDKEGNERILPIFSERIDPAPGTHIITYKSDVDTIQLSHEAHSRDGFALGAVIAAEWILDKKGTFTMRDLFSNLI